MQASQDPVRAGPSSSTAFTGQQRGEPRPLFGRQRQQRGGEVKSRERPGVLCAAFCAAFAGIIAETAVLAGGFYPYKGFFHANRHGKPSLALDLLEEFRPVIADSVVLTLINNEMLTPKDFLTWKESCQLTEEGRKKFFRAYEMRKSTVVAHPVYGYRMSYSRMLEVQARMLAAYVRGDVPRYTGFTVR
jgi:hypothetical protein